MTENKRFTYMEQFNGFCDVYDNGKILSCMRLEYVENTVNLLNELHEENIILKKVIEEDDDLIKSFLSAYCNRKWKKFCKSYGVDFE